MMNQQKTNKAGLLKYSLVVPLTLALIISSNAQAIVSKAKEALNETTAIAAPQNSQQQKQEQPVKTTVKFTAPVIEKDKQVFEVVEKMPQYPGGVSGLMEYLSRNIKYPVAAIEANVQGKVFVKFIINKNGNVEQAKIVMAIAGKNISKSKDDLMVIGAGPNTQSSKADYIEGAKAIDAEALRVVNAMPQWIPGEQDGKKVAVYYTLPIYFKLNDDKPSLNSIDKNNPPVIFVDDVQMAQDFDISSIKPEEINSINVLKPKDEKEKAEFIAKYGAQGANGVIKITKK